MVNVFLLFRYILPLEKGVVFHFNKLESSSAKKALCQVEISPVVLEKIFSNLVIVFSLFYYYLPLEKVGIFL